MQPVQAVLPQAFLDRLARIIPADQHEAVLATFAQPKPTAVRLNTLKADPSELVTALSTRGFVLDPVPWYPAACVLRNKRLADLQDTPAYQEGRLYVQSLSSLLPVLILDPQPGQTVLDLAAAPGGKTTQIACHMRGQGRLVANDNNRIRFYKLRANVQQQGAINVELSRKPGEWFGRAQPEAFDRVLVDAPCGTEGRFYTARPSSYNYWKPRKIHEMVVKQRRLILAGAQATAPGGVLVYSTCTFAPEENEGIVQWLLQRLDGAVEVEAITLPIPNTMVGLSSWEHVVFDPRVRRAVRVLPTSEMEGFFLAKLRKIRQNTLR